MTNIVEYLLGSIGNTAVPPRPDSSRLEQVKAVLRGMPRHGEGDTLMDCNIYIQHKLGIRFYEAVEAMNELERQGFVSLVDFRGQRRLVGP